MLNDMNPLCCIAPVSMDQDHDKHAAARTPSKTQLVHDVDSSARTMYVSRLSLSTELSSISVSVDADRNLSFEDQCVNGFVSGAKEFNVFGTKGSDSMAVAGVLHKWVNYGKRWKIRWFVLEEGVLSYYKIQGPSKVLTSQVREKNVRVIGEESLKYFLKGNNGDSVVLSTQQQNPVGQIPLKVSSVRASRSDDKRFTIFTGTKTLHLRCTTREDRTMWLDALRTAKDLFSQELTTRDVSPSEDIVISTESLRVRLLQDGVDETTIKDCESIMLQEFSGQQTQFRDLQQRHIVLLARLRKLEAEKMELEATVVDETKERRSYCGQADRRFSDFYSVLSEGSASDSDADNGSQCGACHEGDEGDVLFFDTNDFLSSDSLRSVSRHARESENVCIYDNESNFSECFNGVTNGIRTPQYPCVERRNSLPEPKEKEKAVGLWSIIKDNIGKDLSGVCLPVYFNEPLSSLQKCFEDLEYSYLVDRALEWGRQVWPSPHCQACYPCCSCYISCLL